jgi:hypothetical protein
MLERGRLERMSPGFILCRLSDVGGDLAKLGAAIVGAPLVHQARNSPTARM